MVLQKRLSYGSSASTAYQVAAMPYIPSSAKGKRSARKKVEENQMCAIDLLATVAGQLLEVEGENFSSPLIGAGASSSKQCVKQEQPHSRKLVKVEAYDGTSFSSKEPLENPNTVSRHASVLFNSDASDKDCSVRKPVISLGRSKESWECKAEDGITTPRRAERMSGNLMDTEPPRDCSFEDPMDMDSKPPALVSSDSSVEVQLCRDRIGHSSSFDKQDTGTKLALSRDDDENSSGCTHPDNSRALKPQRIGDRRIKKLLASKFLEVASTMFKDAELSDTERKPVLRGSKLCYTRQRTQRCTFKRRKLFERYTVSPSSRDLCGEGTSNSTIKGSIKVEPSISQAKLHGETGAFSSSSGKDPSHESGDLQVKFSIKSFKVPELFFDMHKTATVDSLKRTVMEAVTAALGSGLCVGVYVQGEKVWDDSKTLLQAGISHANELDDLDFTLESNPNQALPRLPEGFLPPCDSTAVTAPLTRIPAAVPPSDQGASSGSMLEPPMPKSAVNCPESDHDSVHSLTDDSNPEKVATNSKAMVSVPALAERVEPLATVPALRKARRLDLVQRRIRRPFSVTEVEALVQAVEKLGTGRWRDVKIRAFDNSKHRTYVDLKDKWKTLVHTAKISPQQRRGAPVPQDLLDRVLAAHAYWTNHQVKPATEPALLLI